MCFQVPWGGFEMCGEAYGIEETSDGNSSRWPRLALDMCVHCALGLSVLNGDNGWWLGMEL